MSSLGKIIGGMLLLAIGASIFFGVFGIQIGGLISFAIAIALVVIGLKQLKEGHQVFGIIVLIVGAMMLIGSIPFLISLVIAGVCIYFGWKLLKGHDNHDPDPAPTYTGDVIDHQHVDVDSHFDAEWD